MVKRWLRRLILWALEENERPLIPAAPAVRGQSAQLYEEWLNGAPQAEEPLWDSAADRR